MLALAKSTLQPPLCLTDRSAFSAENHTDVSKQMITGFSGRALPD